MNECKYCAPVGESICVIDYDNTRLFVDITGAYLRIFDEEYPGHTSLHQIKFCPMCGRNLHDNT